MALRIASVVLTISGALALVLGIAFWFGQGRQFTQLHMVLGLLVVLSLWMIAAVQAATKRGSWPIVLSALLVGGLVLFVGVRQTSLLQGQFHWVIELFHLVLGGLAIGLGRRAARVEQRVTPVPSAA